MLLFTSDDDKNEKFDPVSAVMVLIKKKVNLKKINLNKENVLHFSCKVGATISTLTLINEGADLEQ